MANVPRSLVEYVLLGRVSPGESQRFTQDAGIVADVWLTFAEDLSLPRRILLTPIDGLTSIETAAAIHDALRRYRTSGGSSAPEDAFLSGVPISRAWTNVAPLENFVAVTLYFDELIRIILPLTKWWEGKQLGSVRKGPVRSGFRNALEVYIASRLGDSNAVSDASSARNEEFPSGEMLHDLKAAMSIVALIGIFVVAADPEASLENVLGFKPDDAVMSKWTSDNARAIARAAVRELGRASSEAVSASLKGTAKAAARASPALIQRVFLDRPSQLADSEAICTVKADAADRLFNISCRGLAWAVIDCGVAADHPAFAEFEVETDGRQIRNGRSRVRATYDLTLIDRIRNFDLTTTDPLERSAVIADVIRDLTQLPGKRADDFARVAATNLRLIADQLRRRILPDWGLIEPLIRIEHDDGTGLSSDHGTHVAGILGGDWRAAPPDAEPGSPEEAVLRGVCPDISLYDLRVLHPRSMKNTEFAVIAALEFVRHLNGRASGPPIIHGVNISLSIPHEVRNYGCGVTPVCVACDDLVQSGVVVVAAAGNRGWNERELGFGNFVFCSITDPGNAQRVITVGATHRLKPHTYGVSYFSSRGPTGDGRIKPDLVAPGEKIRGPVRGGADDELDGTSMAAPFVSGAAAMLMARNRELMRNPQRIKEILCGSATDLGRERYFQGHGLVDVLRALQSI